MAVVVVVVVAEAPSSVVVMVMWHCSRFNWVVSLFNLVNLASVDRPDLMTNPPGRVKKSNCEEIITFSELQMSALSRH